MPVLRLKLADVFATETPGSSRLADHASIVVAVMERFSFLRPPIVVALEGDDVVITYQDEEPSQKSEAERLAERASKRAAEGDYNKAISLWKRVLELQPSLHRARRDLAMALMEVRDVEGAVNHLIEVLRFDPKDAWSWVVLANLYIREKNDNETGEKFLRRALEIAPDDAWALNSLAAVTAERGNIEEAVAIFERAIAANPEFANAHYGLAVALYRDEKFDGALTALQRLFREARMQDARSKPVFDGAREMFARLQAGLAQRGESDAFKAVQNYKAEIEPLAEYPVRIEEAGFEDRVGATIQMAWKHGRSYHLIRTRQGYPKELLAHLEAHELSHLRMETAARRAGTNLFFTTTAKTRETAIRSFAGEIEKWQKQGYSEKTITSVTLALVNGVCGFLFNCPLDMIIERDIHERFPALRPHQFVSVGGMAKEAWQTNNNPEVRKLTPRRVMNASLALNGAYALFLDAMFQGATAYAENYRALDTFSTSRRLWDHWRGRSAQLSPGEEYRLVDDFADIVGLRAWYEWKPDSGKHTVTEEEHKEGTTNPELLKEKHPAAVFFLLDALQRFDRMTTTQVRDVAFEIAILGQKGLDYASPDKKYTLRSIPGDMFSGLQLMCLMHAGFKRLAPEQDTGMDLDAPFLTALQLHKPQ